MAHSGRRQSSRGNWKNIYQLRNKRREVTIENNLLVLKRGRESLAGFFQMEGKKEVYGGEKIEKVSL